MEGSHVAVQKEGETSSHEKQKRKLKTPAQVEALEELYNEHKYPSEAMKLEFAKKIGLSEKQVSGWFCHRRLKERKILQGEIYTNGKQNLSSSGIHDLISGIKQESCSSTKQVDRNLDSKEVESKMYYAYKSSSDALACEAHNKHPHIGNNHVAEDRSSGGNSASQGSLLQSNENLYVAQPSRYKLCDDSSLLMSNKNTVIKSEDHLVNPRYSFLQDETDSPAISALKWNLGRHYREDGPLLSFEFDPLPPGAFDSPVRDSKCEPYYVGDSMQHDSSSFYRSINEHRVYDKYYAEKLASEACQEQRSSKRTKPGFIDSNEITNLGSTENAIPNHVQYQAISIDETEKSMNRTSCFDGRNNLRFLNYKTEWGHGCKDGYNVQQNSQSTNIKNYFPCPNYDTEVFQGEYFDTKPFVAAPKKYDSISSECWHQPQKILKDNTRNENTKRNHSAIQPDMFIKSRNNRIEKVNGVGLWKQQYPVKGLEKPARQVPLIRHPLDVDSNLLQDVSGDTSLSLD
ncbi:hypothetical protein KFK09_020732 [Dendrobium nobile]|uniref:Homeobox domain-containing protein n=1 Tax=Dendrobium nobile TaxID=94219 RepID=A0A8T3AMI1_DENNO|nr:hypothetical protein KFK09_020732 [Dendrobium nobile]